MTKHIPVLQNEAIAGMHLEHGVMTIDATLGGGGYTREILSIVGKGNLISLDRDITAIERFRRSYPDEANDVALVHANFANIADIVHDRGIVPMAIVADLGISSDQLDDSRRGLSFRAEGPLDMRLDQSGYADQNTVQASELLMQLSVSDLAHIFRRYGDEPFAMPIARRIVQERVHWSLPPTTKDLTQIIVDVVPQRMQHRGKHPATRVFQALRIAVNHEYDDLERFLDGALTVLSSGGYLAIVSFHSGEDAIVKHFAREQSRGCVCPSNFPICQCAQKASCEIITKKPIVPTASEIARNPRSRSAKLRIIRKK